MWCVQPESRSELKGKETEEKADGEAPGQRSTISEGSTEKAEDLVVNGK